MPSTRRHLIPAVLAVALALALATGVVASQVLNFVTPLSGAAEVPIRDTHARGAAIFQLNADGTEISYRLIASNIHNVTMAHIHLQNPGELTGGIVVWLAPSTQPGVQLPAGGGRHDGVLATGTFDAGDLVGALAGGTLADLLDAIDEGIAYVNVHTNDGVAPADTGPGDFPGGEIRGQLP
jgi:CHRD domain